MNKPLPKTAHARTSQADTDLVSLSKRLTQRAAAELEKSEPHRDYSHLSLEAEGDHIAALRRYIIAKEAAIGRFREQIARFPEDISTLRERLDEETDVGARRVISKNLEAYSDMQETLRQRVESFDLTWPDRRAEMEAAIHSYEARKLGAGEAEG